MFENQGSFICFNWAFAEHQIIDDCVIIKSPEIDRNKTWIFKKVSWIVHGWEKINVIRKNFNLKKIYICHRSDLLVLDYPCSNWNPWLLPVYPCLNTFLHEMPTIMSWMICLNWYEWSPWQFNMNQFPPKRNIILSSLGLLLLKVEWTWLNY